MNGTLNSAYQKINIVARQTNLEPYKLCRNVKKYVTLT